MGKQKILIGTGNTAKFDRYKIIVESLGSFVGISPKTLRVQVRVAEDGATTEENARSKALAFAQASGLISLAVDEALHVDGLPPEKQPGLYVRRFGGGRALSDEEVLQAYLKIFSKLPRNKRVCRWTWAVSIAQPYGTAVTEAIDLWEGIGTKPNFPIIPGYPLSSLLTDVTSGKPLRDLSPEEEQKRLAPLYTLVKKLLKAACLLRTSPDA